MSCFDCKFFTGEDYLACGVDPITAASSPEEGCRDWQPTEDDGYRPVSLEVRTLSEVLNEGELLFHEEHFRLEVLEIRLDTIPHPYIGEWVVGGVRVIGNSLWRNSQGNIEGYAEAWKLEDKEWYVNPDPLSGSGQMLVWFNNLIG